MKESLQQAVSDILDYLLALQQERVRPREARARLQPLRGRHPDLQIDLLTEEQTYDQSVHYDALLRRAGEGTLSVSYCPERALPWPLRGVHRWNEGDLLRIDGRVLSVEAAMASLDFIWDDTSMIERLVNICLIQQEVERNPVDLTDAELQAAMDKFRLAKKLFKAEDTRHWLERHGMTHEKLERYVAESAIVPKLRDRIAGGHVEEYFGQHQNDFDTARIARFELPDPRQAGELAEQIRAGQEDFFAAAERAFSEAAQRGAPSAASLFAIIDRRDAAPQFREQLFAATPRQLVGPVEGDTGYALIRVLAVQPARLDERTRAVIKKILFDNWLAERRQAAQVEWCWGNISKTTSA